MKNSTQTADDIRIYVACLASYNNGILHGAWIDAAQSEDEIRDGINKVLATSPIPNAEDWAIHGYDGFEGAYIEEYTSIAAVCDLAQFIADHGKLGAELYNFSSDMNEAREMMDNNYHGCYASLRHLAVSLCEDLYDLPESILPYINHEKMIRDLSICDVFTIETAHDEVHVFWQH